MSEPQFVIVGRNVWGSGASQDEAKAQFRRGGGRLTDGYVVLYFDGVTSEFAGVDPVSGAVNRYGERPVEVARRNPPKT